MDETLKIIPWETPKPKGILHFNKNVAIMLYDPLPCKFHRFMVKMFFGIWYEELSDD